MITKVTITGADDSIDPIELLKISDRFPFVEWGILISAKKHPTRFPSTEWLDNLGFEFYDCFPQQGYHFSLHVCGRWVRDFLATGSDDFIKHLGQDCFDIFERIQLNTHGERHEFSSRFLDRIYENSDRQFIFQQDRVNKEILDLVTAAELTNIAALFDLSHGAGLLPAEWPDLIPNIKCGYAGGLSPENLAQQIVMIEQKAGDKEIWIDMESHVRSNMDKVFDLQKVERCLQIAEPFIKPSTDRTRERIIGG